MRRWLALSLCLAAPALAHGGPHERDQPGWTLDPWVGAPLALLAFAYASGAARLWRRAERGKPRLQREAMLFGMGWLVLAGALLSPLHEAGERSFTMHMIEHELIMLVASLLLVASRPGPTLLWSLPRRGRSAAASLARSPWLQGTWQALTHPIMATGLQAAAMWTWHAPALFDRALAHSGWHVAQHLSFLLTSLLFWQAMVRAHDRHGFGVSAFCLFATSMIGGLLGALMSFAHSPWYAGYAAMGMTPFGLSPVEDQQLAGLLMWIPGGLVHAGAALYFAWRWLEASGGGHALRR